MQNIAEGYRITQRPGFQNLGFPVQFQVRKWSQTFRFSVGVIPENRENHREKKEDLSFPSDCGPSASYLGRAFIVVVLGNRAFHFWTCRSPQRSRPCRFVCAKTSLRELGCYMKNSLTWQVKPYLYLDWNKLYGVPCLLNNPLAAGVQKSSENCAVRVFFVDIPLGGGGAKPKNKTEFPSTRN